MISLTYCYNLFSFFFFLLLNSVYTVLPLSQGLNIGLKGEYYSQVCTYKIVLECLCLSVIFTQDRGGGRLQYKNARMCVFGI